MGQVREFDCNSNRGEIHNFDWHSRVLLIDNRRRKWRSSLQVSDSDSENKIVVLASK